MLEDIQSREDIEQLMRAFYAQALAHPELGPKFQAMDLEDHIPKIVDFWQSTSIGGAEYTGSPFAPHKPLGLEEKHFALWLALFELTLRERFEGPVVDQFMQKAQHVANMFRFKLGLM